MSFNIDSKISEIEEIISNPSTEITKKWTDGGSDGVTSFIFYELKLVNGSAKKVCYEYRFGKMQNVYFI